MRRPRLAGRHANDTPITPLAQPIFATTEEPVGPFGLTHESTLRNLTVSYQPRGGTARVDTVSGEPYVQRIRQTARGQAPRDPHPAGPFPHGVEEKSQGRWKAVVVGSYERGDRAVTVQRLAELADFYGVPVQELLPGTTPRRRRAAAEAGPRPGAAGHVPPEKAGPLQRYAATIQSQRGDYNGKVLSIRQDDLRTLAVIYDQSPSVLTGS